MNLNKNSFFERQITLKEIGEEGQQYLQDAKVLVVGCGGLGSPIAVYLASSGIGEIHLVDFDTVAVSNLHRQVMFTLDDVGNYKAEVLASFIKQRTPFTQVSFSTEAVKKHSVLELISNFDIVVDATDSLPTKYMLNDACVLQNKPLVYGSLYKFDGYVGVFNMLQKDGDFSTNLRDAFPEMATDVPNCEEAGTLNAIVGIIALQQVNEVLKLVTGIGKPLINQLLIYNSLENSQLKMKLKSTISKSNILEIFETETYFDASCELQNSEWLISADQLKRELLLDSTLKPLIISVIEEEVKYPFTVDKIISLVDLNKGSFKPEDNRKYVLVCEHGIKSYTAVSIIKEQFLAIEILSLVGGISKY